jgi:pyruvate kinase
MRPHHSRKAKIVATIGPASRGADVLERLVEAGVDVARLNFSHGTHEEHAVVVRTLRACAERVGRPIAILQDLAGPKVRIGMIAAGNVILQPGSSFVMTARDVQGDAGRVSVTYPELPAQVRAKDTILLGDGAIELEVEETTADEILCRVVVGGALSSHKGVNLPTRSIGLPSLTEKDWTDLAFGIELGVDFVALSFVRSAADVRSARRFLEERGARIPLIAKIEKHEALDCIDAILDSVDGIMVARGDLGVEIPLERVPLVQKMLIAKANRAGKPVITATQMLRSMVDNPRPTRAEVTDVANAVLDGTDAVMLSEETAAGSYPREAVATMAKIIESAEAGFPHEHWIARVRAPGSLEIDDAVALAACELAEEVGAEAIVSCTRSGATARLVAKYRPRTPLIAATPDPSVFRHLALVWGVIPLHVPRTECDVESIIAGALDSVNRAELAGSGETVVVTAGVTSTSMLRAVKLM